MRRSLCFVVAVGVACGSLFAAGSHAQFNAVINIPPDLPPESKLSSNTQLNLFEGGRLMPLCCDAYGAGSEVNIYGGVAIAYVSPGEGTTNIFGGIFQGTVGAGFGREYVIPDATIVNIAGGLFQDGLYVKSPHDVEIIGGEFILNGDPVAGLSTVGDSVEVEVPDSAALSGILRDGTPFSFVNGENTGSKFERTVTLTASALPPVGPPDIHASSHPIPFGLRNGQTLTIDAKVDLGRYLIAGPQSIVNVDQGTLTNATIRAVGGTVNVLNGSHNTGFESVQGGVINIREAIVGRVTPIAGGIVNMSAGQVGTFSGPGAGGEFNWSGGTLGRDFRASANSKLKIVGGEFQLDGQPIADLDEVGDRRQLDLGIHMELKELTGVLADGTPFALGYYDDDYVGGSVILEVSSLPSIGPAEIVVGRDAIPLGIRVGQTLEVGDGHRLPENFNAGPGSILNVLEGGEVGEHLQAIGATVNVNGGKIARSFYALNDSTINVTGNSNVKGIKAFNHSVVNVWDGKIDTAIQVINGSNLNVFDGSIGTVLLGTKSTFHFSGGDLGPSLFALSDGEFHVFGTEFAINGTPIENLQIGEMHPLSLRDFSFSGTLANGDTFSIFVEGPSNVPPNYEATYLISNMAKLTVTRVHQPGDFNGDKVVNQADYDVWLNAMVTGDLAADGNYDRRVTSEDLAVWHEHLGANYGVVPEPASAVLLVMGMAIGVRPQRWRAAVTADCKLQDGNCKM
jgi:hypothetical protein